MKTTKEQITLIKQALVEFTEERFAVKLENDDVGMHYTIYLSEKKDLKSLQNTLSSLKLTKHCIIIIADNDFVAIKGE